MRSTRILAVDDDPRQLASLKRVLRRSQFVVDTATNGRIGLRTAVQNPPDLILLDVSMPTMSGYEFLRRLRRLEKRLFIGRNRGSPDQTVEEIPVIFLTALGKPAQRVDGLNSSAVDYITKPFEPDELRARIRNQLRQTRQQKEMLTSRESELLQLESAIGAALEAVGACQEPLNHLETCLVQAAYTDHADRRRELVIRAKEDIESLTQSLSNIAEWLATNRG